MLKHSVQQERAAAAATVAAAAIQAEAKAAEAKARHSAAVTCVPFLFGAAAIPMLSRAYAEHSM